MNKNLKKVISSAAVVAMVASSASAFAATFPDVDASASYAGAVSNLTALGIVQGDENGLFNPDNSVTRAEFAKMVVESLGKGDAAASITSTSFADCVGHWGAGYIATGVSEGFINGYGDGNFGPNDTVTYAQAVKMLVAAIGYDMQANYLGGYPSGYLSYGSTLDIIKGVSGVTNDTALTRAQCAVLVSNALQAPVCVIEGYTQGGLTGTVLQPNYVEKNGKGEGWQTLLTKYHDAYVVRGRVTETSRTNSGLDAGEVMFRVESADNFDGEYITKSDENTREEPMLVGDTAAEDMFRVYAEAIVQYDDNTDEWTILSIAPQGSNKTVEFDASLVSEDEVDGYKDGDNNSIGMYKANKIPVQKSESSSSVTTYKLNPKAEVYVNGVAITDPGDATLEEYILNNETGKVTLIDETDVGSTSTDGYYDCIMITYYADAVVDYTQTTSSYNRIGFKAYDNIDSRIQWDPEDDDRTVTFTKDGKSIEWTELAEYDVLSIAYDVTGAFKDSEFYDVMVAQNTVSGTVTSRDVDSDKDIFNSIRVDGTEYDVAGLLTPGDIELSGSYTFYLNAFNYIVYADENASSKNVGVFVGMYESNSSTYPIIKYIDSEGNVVTKEAKDMTEAEKFYDLVNAEKSYAENDYPTVKVGTDITSENIMNMVFEYSLSSGKIKFKDSVNPVNKADDKGNYSKLEYRADQSRLGSYTLNESVTKILDLDAYLNDDGNVGVMSLSTFVDDAEYSAFLYDRNSSGDYRLCLVLEGTTSITADTTVAVVMSNPQETEIDGTQYTTFTVAKDGQEDVTVNVEETDLDVAEGDVIVYSLKSDGTAVNLTKLVDANVKYEGWYTDSKPMISSPTVDVWTSSDKDVETYFGPVYQKSNNNIEIFTKEAGTRKYTENGEEKEIALASDILTDTEMLNISGANAYIYDYSSSEKYRVTAGAVPNVSKSIYNKDVVLGDDNTVIDWSAVVANDVNPSFAFVKVVDNYVTDVVFFLAN